MARAFPRLTPLRVLALVAVVVAYALVLWLIVGSERNAVGGPLAGTGPSERSATYGEGDTFTEAIPIRVARKQSVEVKAVSFINSFSGLKLREAYVAKLPANPGQTLDHWPLTEDELGGATVAEANDATVGPGGGWYLLLRVEPTGLGINSRTGVGVWYDLDGTEYRRFIAAPINVCIDTAQEVDGACPVPAPPETPSDFES